MKITELNKHADKLDKKIKMPILAIIQIKTESDMEKVIARLDSFESKLETKLTAINFQIKIILWVIAILSAANILFGFLK